LLANPACNCLGYAPARAYAEGSTCALNGQTIPWCFVNSSCADAVPSATYPGWFTSVCGAAIASCSGFSLNRICSAYRPACDIGWQLFGLRCYRYFGANLSFNDASNQCALNNGSVATIFQQSENAFLVATFQAQLQASNGTWIGYTTTSGIYQWIDGSTGLFTNWAPSQPDALVPACAYMSATGLWFDTNCSTSLSYFCEKPTLGMDFSCSCTGQVDANGYGGSCNYWTLNNPPWCYVSPVSFEPFGLIHLS
jgi:hypothetical protein